MKTKNNKLIFGKNAIIELNDSKLNNVKGGSLSIDEIKELISDCFSITDRF